jgi:hypothetical protein
VRVDDGVRVSDGVPVGELVRVGDGVNVGRKVRVDVGVWVWKRVGVGVDFSCTGALGEVTGVLVANGATVIVRVGVGRAWPGVGVALGSCGPSNWYQRSRTDPRVRNSSAMVLLSRREGHRRRASPLEGWLIPGDATGRLERHVVDH